MVDLVLNLMLRLASVGFIVTAIVEQLGGGDRDSVVLLLIAGFVVSKSADISHVKSRLGAAKETT